MTAAVAAGPVRAVPVPVVLGLQEGWRIARHPVAVLGALLTVLVVSGEQGLGPRAAFELVTTGPTLFYGVVTYFAANLVASRDRRARSGELLAATPAPVAERVAGLCLGALVPALLCAVAVAVGHAVLDARGAYGAVADPTVWHLAQGPLTVLGGALLGIMVGRLTTVPGVALLVMVSVVAYEVWLRGEARTAFQPLGTYVAWAAPGPGTGWAGFAPGSAVWHDAYLLGLCAMAACGAFLRDAPRRGRVLAVGALLTAVTAVPAVLQLP